MNKIKLLPLLLIFVYVNAQELDQSYLDSLPKDIKEDLMKRANKNVEGSEENYRSSLYSSKFEQAEDLIDLKTRLEADLLELERRLKLDEELSISSDLELFGADFFKTFQTSFMPINEPNPDSSYTLDNGDILKIQLIGQINVIETVKINRDGTVNIYDIGKVNVAGLSVADASKIIKSRVDSVLIGTDVYVNLEEIRDVNVLVSGNAQNPGIYTLTGNSNILHALTVAGGVNEYGSYREINLVRNGNIIETLDVYDLLIDGNYSLSKRLRSGDVIFVESRKNVISIDGAVKRSAKYEVADDEFLDSVIRFSNGIKQTADLENISLNRLLDGTLKSLPIRNVSQFSSIKPIEGDLIYIREYSYRSATIRGAVNKPGKYTMAAGETIDDLVIKAGGFTDIAYPFGTVYENKDAKLINQKAQQLLYEEFLDNIIALSQLNIGQNFDLTPILTLTAEIKNTEPSGRVVVNVSNSSNNEFEKVQIKDGDELIIPEISNNVYVYGEISTEGSVIYSPNQDVEYFVDKSGGFKKFADVNSIYILHPNGESVRYEKKRNIFESEPKSKIKVYPGSVIFVPRKLDESTPRRLATQAYVSILGNIGIALASLSSINNN